jgi:hypothetical protein
MKFTLITSAVTAALIAAAPAPASAGGLSVGISVNDGSAAGHLVLADHNRDYRDHRRPGRPGHGPRRHGRYGRCESWRFAHRKLHSRFGHVRLQHTIRNRRGDKVFIALASNHRGRAYRVRYNACLGRVMNVTPLRAHHPRRHGRRH